MAKQFVAVTNVNAQIGLGIIRPKMRLVLTVVSRYLISSYHGIRSGLISVPKNVHFSVTSNFIQIIKVKLENAAVPLLQKSIRKTFATPTLF